MSALDEPSRFVDAVSGEEEPSRLVEPIASHEPSRLVQAVSSVGEPAPARRVSLRVAVILAAILNNLPFCFVAAAAQHLTDDVFEMPMLTPAFLFTPTAACLVGALLNVVLLRRGLSFEQRITITIVLQLVSVVMVALSTRVRSGLGISIALGGTSVLGLSQFIGEVTHLGVLPRCFKPSLGLWGMGTGLSGLVGPLLVLGFARSGASDVSSVASLGMGACLYLLCMRRIVRDVPELLRERGGGADASGSDDSERYLSLDADVAEVAGASAPLVPPAATSARRALSHTWFLALNLVCVFALEYEIYPGCVDADTKRPMDRRSWLQRSAYSLAWACYNVGVTLARFSINVVRIRRVWVLTLLQALNCALWFVEAKTRWLAHRGDAGYAAMLVWMVWVGCMGGASYVNCVYRLNHDADIPDDVREVSITIAFALTDVGIMSATALSIVWSATIFKDSSS